MAATRALLRITLPGDTPKLTVLKRDFQI